MRAVLRREFPDWGIDGEEYGAEEGTSDDAPHWVIDPVDGTTNYAHGLGWCSFSLGLAEPDGSPLLGLVADPWRGEVFTAVRGKGAHLNGTSIHAADHTTLTGHVFLTEWAAHAHWPGLDALLARLADRHCTARVMGSTALSLVQVAAGRATAAAIGEFHPVDGLPALLIATEAGAVAMPQLLRTVSRCCSWHRKRRRRSGSCGVRRSEPPSSADGGHRIGGRRCPYDRGITLR